MPELFLSLLGANSVISNRQTKYQILTTNFNDIRYTLYGIPYSPSPSPLPSKGDDWSKVTKSFHQKNCWPVMVYY